MSGQRQSDNVGVIVHGEFLETWFWVHSVETSRLPFVRSISFSSGDTPLQVLEMNARPRYEAEMAKVTDLGEYFPGAGTDFQKPLDAALECLKKSKYKKGDVVFITDGECQVTPEWAEKFRDDKEKLGFSLYSILIDVGPSSLGTLKEFSDRITTIKQLTGDEAKDIFVKF